MYASKAPDVHAKQVYSGPLIKQRPKECSLGLCLTIKQVCWLHNVDKGSAAAFYP